MSTRFPVEQIASPASALTDYSGNTTAATSTQIMAADSSARMYRIQNLSTTVNLWVNDTGGMAGAYTPGSYMLAPGAYYEFPSPFAVSVYADSVIPFSAARY